jgi:hypothetical protein
MICPRLNAASVLMKALGLLPTDLFLSVGRLRDGDVAY